VGEWDEHLERERRRFMDGDERLHAIRDPDERERQLTRMGNAAWGAGLCCLMRGERESANAWFDRAAGSYRESLETAPPESWGRYIGSMKCRVLADDSESAEEEAHATLGAGAAGSVSSIGTYGAVLAHLVLADDGEALRLATELRERDDFPAPVSAALELVAAADLPGYSAAVAEVLASFEEREEYLEGVPVADTVLVLQALARRRGMVVELSSPLLPG
jgi:hypothetical protein